MDFKYSFHQMDHSDFVIRAVETKVGRSMRYLFGRAQAHVAVGKKGHEFTISISISGKRGVYYKASASSESLYIAIDLVQDKLEKQIKKQKQKQKNHKHPSLTKEGRMELLDEGLSLQVSPPGKGPRKAA